MPTIAVSTPRSAALARAAHAAATALGAAVETLVLWRAALKEAREMQDTARRRYPFVDF